MEGEDDDFDPGIHQKKIVIYLIIYLIISNILCTFECVIKGIGVEINLFLFLKL